MKIKLLFAFVILGTTSFAQKKLLSYSNSYFEYDGSLQNTDSTKYTYLNWNGSIYKLKPEFNFYYGLFLNEVPELNIVSNNEKIYSGTPGSMLLNEQYNNAIVNNQITVSTEVSGTSRKLYTYDAAGNQTSAVNQSLISGNWYTNDRMAQTFNANNKILTRAGYYNNGSTMEISNTDTSTYNASSGLLTKFVSYYIDFTSSTLTLSDQSLIQYIGNKVDYVDYYTASTTPGTLEWSFRYKYTYTGNNPTKLDAFNIIGAAPAPIAFADLTMTYNAQNNMIKSVTKISTDTLELVNYTYLDADFLSQVTYFETDTADNLYKSSELKYYYENTLGLNPTETIVSAKIYPNPAQNEIRISGVEGLKSIKVLNLAGQILIEQNTATIDISHLPNGTYLVNGSTDSGTFTKTFVKQ